MNRDIISSMEVKLPAKNDEPDWEYMEEYRRSGNAVTLDTVLLRNLFLLGARREDGEEYPSPAYGYGNLNLYGVFEFLRNL